MFERASYGALAIVIGQTHLLLMPGLSDQCFCDDGVGDGWSVPGLHLLSTAVFFHLRMRGVSTCRVPLG